MLFELLPFFEFYTLQFCNCDISGSIIGRGSNFYQLVEYNEMILWWKFKKKSYDFLWINAVWILYFSHSYFVIAI